ncbi:unnamed protein product [Moneuplotes crassus]|uniref:Uncharacterized protein n=1 Tax=Euplotes crassus TaxID=5936 RepID=A0AAD1U634_EUPCR|nr:unnamed protein product [Moneuplotes crassus]
MMNLKDVILTPSSKNKVHKKLILEVAKKANCKGKISMLVRRLQKILNNNNNFCTQEARPEQNV